MEYVERFGADTARCYILFIGPPSDDADWQDSGVGGVHRFLSRLWTAAAEVGGTSARPARLRRGEPSALLRKAHWAIDKVTRDMQTNFGFNTAIAAVMELTNEIYRQRGSAPPGDVRFAVATAGSLIFPFAPHLGAEVYEMMTGRRVWEEPWPEADPALLARDEIQLVVQVNGKLIDRLRSRDFQRAGPRLTPRPAPRLARPIWARSLRRRRPSPQPSATKLRHRPRCRAGPFPSRPAPSARSRSRPTPCSAR